MRRIFQRREVCHRKHGSAKERPWSDYHYSYTTDHGTHMYTCNECKRLWDEEEAFYYSKAEVKKREQEEADRLYWEKVRERQEDRRKRQLNDLWDFIVIDELARGTGLKGEERRLFKESLPKELLQLKRASLKLQRLIDQKKKGIKDKKDKLKQPLIKCYKHGGLYLKDVIKAGICPSSGEQKYKCRECMRNIKKNYYENNKTYVLEKTAKYRAENPDKIKEIKANYNRKQKHGKNRKHEDVA